MAVRFQSHKKTKGMIYLAILTALVAVLSFIKIPIGIFSITLTLPVIVIGAALCGPLASAWLGGVFSLMVIVSGEAASFMTVDPFGTVLTVFLKGILAGLIAGLLYRLLAKLNTTLAVAAAAIAAPIVNTGIFLGGCALFFYETVSEWGAAFGFESGVSYMFLGLAGGNFLVELAVNLILCPTILRLIQLILSKKQI